MGESGRVHGHAAGQAVLDQGNECRERLFACVKLLEYGQGRRRGVHSDQQIPRLDLPVRIRGKEVRSRIITLVHRRGHGDGRLGIGGVLGAGPFQMHQVIIQYV